MPHNLSIKRDMLLSEVSAAGQGHGGECWLVPAPLAVQASGGVDQGAKDPREEGADWQLSEQLGQEVGSHFIAPLAALPSDDGALLRKGGACLHQ